MLTRALAALVLAGACRGGPSAAAPAPPPPARRPASAADIPAMRALLARYSPTGQGIVSGFERLPGRFVLGATTITVSHGHGFPDYFDDGAPEHVVDFMSTAVHEVYHAWSSSMGYQLLADRHLPAGAGAEALSVGREPLLVTYGPLYPAREMALTFPADARTSRYATYVSPSQESQSTQKEGVFGLLDEWTAYYHTGRTVVDLWPWVRDASPASEPLIVQYVARLHETWVPRAEFELFILHYLRHARDHHPDVYRALLANDGFRRAFATCDDGWGALLAEAGDLEPAVHAFARSHGVKVGLRDGQLTFGGSPWDTRDAAYPAVVRALASPAYQELRRELREPPARR